MIKTDSHGFGRGYLFFITNSAFYAEAGGYFIQLTSLHISWLMTAFNRDRFIGSMSNSLILNLYADESALWLLCRLCGLC